MAGFPKKEPTVPVDSKFYGFRYRPCDATAKKLRAICLATDLSANELLIRLVDYALEHARVVEKKLTVRDLVFERDIKVLTVDELGGYGDVSQDDL